MKYCHLELLGFVGILRESIKIPSKNGKLMATIATISILLTSLLFFANTFSTKPILADLLAKQALFPAMIMTQKSSPPGTADLFAGIKEEIKIIIRIELVFFLASFTVSLFSIAATILASALAYSGKTSSFKDLVSRLAKSCVRPLLTFFQIKLIGICFLLLFAAILILLVMIIGADHLFILMSISITLGVLPSVFWIYLSVVWDLAMVISVIEESCYGTEALGKASRLVKGKRLHGFAINFLCAITSVIIGQIFKIKGDQKTLSTEIVMGFLLTVFSCLVMMFEYMSFTVLYFQCKKTHGEEIELQGNIEEYNKIPSTSILNENIP